MHDLDLPTLFPSDCAHLTKPATVSVEALSPGFFPAWLAPPTPPPPPLLDLLSNGLAEGAAKRDIRREPVLAAVRTQHAVQLAP